MSIIPENFARPHGAGRHAWTGLLLAFIPGFGQFYHRQWLKGIIFLVLLVSFIGVLPIFCAKGCGGW